MVSSVAESKAASEHIRGRWSVRPRVGLILGTGLGDYANHIDADVAIPFAELPYFQEATALGHAGKIVCGQVGGVDVVAMQGRLHLYEGHSPQTVTLPVRVMKSLGVETLIVSNAAGGLRPGLATGDVMILSDQINLTWCNPLHGSNDDELGPRFPDMSSPYDPQLTELAMQTARSEGFLCHQGVYAGLTGPTYETRAEYRMLRRLGADLVGMSTVPEVIVAVHSGMRVLGISTVTNLCRPDTLESTSGHQVQAAAERAAPRIRTLVEAVITSYASSSK